MDEAVVPGAEGLFGVRPGHTPFLAARARHADLKDGGKSQAFFVAGGFAEVSADKVLVLADQAEEASRIDLDGGQAPLRRGAGEPEGDEVGGRALPGGDRHGEARGRPPGRRRPQA